MATTTQLRILRRRYNVPLSTLARKVGISNQYLSRIELALVPVKPWQEERLASAITELIADQQTALYDFEREFLLHKGHLLEPMEVESDEL